MFRISPVVSQLNHSAYGTPTKVIAVELILRFSRRMIRLSKITSKLSLVTPVHATACGSATRSVAQLAKGRVPPPRSIPTRVLLSAAAETVPVSVPSTEVRR